MGLCTALSLMVCAPLLAQQPLEVERTLRADLASRSALAWEAGRRLAWADFTGQPLKSSAWAALSFTGIRYAYRCDEQHLEYGVIAYFLPPESWAKPGTVKNRRQSTIVLPHEQGHFDIAEVSARLLRRELIAFAAPCDSMGPAFNAIAEAALVRSEALENRYDAETAHGTFAPAQAQWLAWIAETLDVLGEMSEPWVSRDYTGE
jgi:hypothetical protein